MVTKKEVDLMWKTAEKSRMNISLPKEIAEWLDENAVSNWKLDKGARSKEVLKILLEAKEKSDEDY